MKEIRKPFLAFGMVFFFMGSWIFSPTPFLYAEEAFESGDYALSIQDLIISRHIRKAVEADASLAETASRIRTIVTSDAVTLQGTVPNEGKKKKFEETVSKLPLKHRRLKDQIKVGTA